MVEPSMVERVARVLARMDGRSDDAQRGGEPAWMSYQDKARAALAAMRISDPLSAMVETDRATTELWNRLIEAALAEQR